MPSYTASLRFTLQDTGSNLNVWGNILNSGVFALVDTAIAGRYNTTSSAVTLTSNQGASDTARNAVLDVTGGSGTTFTAPSVSKLYFVRNASSGDTVVTTGGVTNATVKAGERIPVFSDGTNFYRLRLLDMDGDQLSNLATPTTNNAAATKAYVDGIAFQTTGALPAQNPGTAYSSVFSDGTNAAWRRAQPASSAATLGKALKSAGVDGFPETASLWDWDGYQGSPTKSANYTVVQGDRSTLIRCTGTITIAFDALATMGTKSDFMVGNFGTGLITIDPNGTETLTFPGQTAQTTCILIPGEVVRFMGDTTTWRAVLVQDAGPGPHFYSYETTPPTYVPVTTQKRLLATVVVNTIGAVLASGAVTTIPPGRYRAQMVAGGTGTGSMTFRLYNNTLSSVTATGWSAAPNDLGTGYYLCDRSQIDEPIALSSPATSLQLETQGAGAGSGPNPTWLIGSGAKQAEFRLTRVGP